VSLFKGGILQFRSEEPDWPGRDRFLLSKGHAANALYAILAECGFIPQDCLWTIGNPGSPLEEHPCRSSVPGVEISSGSLGHGLPIACGMALSAKIKGEGHRIYVLMSDGECNEGSVWEAAMFAPSQKLGNVTAIIDYNKWQATGRSNEVLALENLSDKWSAFGWRTFEVDGHDPIALHQALSSSAAERPTAIIAHTIKGKGVSFMEDDNNWHYRIPTEGEVARARKELGVAS
jgi:transketolase